MKWKLKRRRSGPPFWEGPDPRRAQRQLEQEGAAPAPLGGSRGLGYPRWRGFWQMMQRWLLANTFTPSWLPSRWRTPMLGYVGAIALQGFFVTVTLLLLQVFPTFAFAGVLEVVGVALIALSWGAGPSLVATLVGALLLEVVIVPPAFAWSLTDAQQVVEVLLFFFAGVLISVVAGQSQRARRNAEQLTILLAVEHAHLNAIIEAMPDEAALYDPHGALMRLNHAWQQLVVSRRSDTAVLPGQSFEPIPTSVGEPFFSPTFPLERVLGVRRWKLLKCSSPKPRGMSAGCR